MMLNAKCFCAHFNLANSNILRSLLFVPPTHAKAIYWNALRKLFSNAEGSTGFWNGFNRTIGTCKLSEFTMSARAPERERERERVAHRCFFSLNCLGAQLWPLTVL